MTALRRLRLRTGYDMTDFAQLVGVKYDRYKGWEVGDCRPPLHLRMRLARLLTAMLGVRVRAGDL